MSVTLRPYQTNAIQAARELVGKGSKRILLVSPTGSGKTLMFCDVIRGAMEKGSRALVLAHRRELIQQTSAKLRDYDVSHGIIMSDVRPAPQRGVQVASVQTLLNRRLAFPECEIIVVDEAHHAVGTGSYERILSWYPNAVVLGVTATPWRHSGEGLMDPRWKFHFDDHLTVATPRQLRDGGYLVPVDAFEYRAVETDGLKSSHGEFVVDAELERRATNSQLMGSVVDEWILHANGKRTIVFAVNVAHSMALCARFRAAGVAAEHVDGNTPNGQRDRIFERLRSGETKVLTQCEIATEGLDLPALECGVLARPTKSLGFALQCMGRLMRPSPETGKDRARIHDHAGVLRLHGHPYDDRDYSPLKTSQEVDAWMGESEKASVNRRRCTKCGNVLVIGEAGACQACGHTFTPEEQLEVERVEVAEGGERKSQGQAWTVHERRMQWVQRTFSDKIAILARMIKKHGPGRAPAVFHWLSGRTEWPNVEIKRAAEEMVAGERRPAQQIEMPRLPGEDG